MRRNRTFFITSIRDPKKRVVSSYFFEGLWRDGTARQNKTMENARTLEDYIDDVQGRRLRWKAWSCVSDCFTKWFGSKRIVQRIIKEFDLGTAFDRLKRHHMIVRTEYMQQPDYWERMRYVLGAENISVAQQKRAGKNKSDNTTRLISTEAMKRLDDLNRKDYELMDCLFEEQ